jgi:hypothetical protein
MSLSFSGTNQPLCKIQKVVEFIKGYDDFMSGSRPLLPTEHYWPEPPQPWQPYKGLSMGFRFRKRIKILPSLWYNLSKKGGSWSIGGQGVTWNSKRGTTYSARGTGLSYTAPRHHKRQGADTPSQVITAQNTADKRKSISGRVVLVALGVCFLLFVSNTVNRTKTDTTLTPSATPWTATLADATPAAPTPLASRQIIRETEPSVSELDKKIAKIQESMQKSRSHKVDVAANENVAALVAAAKTSKIELTQEVFDKVKKDSASSYPGTDDHLWTYEDRWDRAVGEYFLHQANDLDRPTPNPRKKAGSQ